DDTAVVVGALGLVLDQTPKTHQAAPILGATRDAVAWVLGMQNRDGGWGAFVCDMPERPSGPFMTSPPAIDVTHPPALAPLFFEPAAELGDPSTEDLTGRVLHALGTVGMTLEHTAIQKAVEFLRGQQLPDGSWWGRWTNNYVPATACVLIGLKAAGVDMDAP